MSVGLGRTLRSLGEVVDAIEAGDGSITSIDAGYEGPGSEDAFAVRLVVDVPLLPGVDATGLDLAVDACSIDEDGTVRVDLVSAPADGDRPDSSPSEPDTDGVASSDPVPAYRDPARLRAVYEAHDSFPAMTEALGVDVTPQTVRRHMIEEGIHTPDGRDGPDRSPTVDGDTGRATGSTGADDPGSADESPATAGSDQAGSSPPASDGGLDDGPSAPSAGEATELVGDLEGVTVDELKEAIRASRTIHEVGRRLDVPRERAFRLLNDLDLIDLVSGRLESADRPIPAEELDERIERVTSAGD